MSQKYIGVGQSIAPMVSIDVPVVYFGDPENLMDLFALTDMPGDTKLGSALYFAFPWIRPFFNRKYTVLPIGSYINYSMLKTPIGRIRADKIYFESFTVRTAILLIGPAYSLQTKLEAQIYSQMSAAYSALSLNPPSQGVVSREYQAIQYNGIALTSYAYEMISRVLCIGEGFEFKQDIQKGELLPLNAITENIKVAPIYIKFLDQMRLIYTQRHTKSANFGALFISGYERLLAKLGEKWQQEATALKKVAPIIVGSPYVGVGRHLADNLRISNFPRPILYGLLVHEKTLANEAEREEFKKYVTTSVRSHIGSHKDILTIEAAVHTIPDITITALGDKVAMISLTDAQALLLGKSEVELDKILQYVQSKEIKGDWALDRIKQQTKVHMNYVRETCKKFILQRMETELERLDDWIDLAEDAGTKSFRREKKAYIKQEFLSLIKGGRALEEEIVSSNVTGDGQDINPQQ